MFVKLRDITPTNDQEIFKFYCDFLLNMQQLFISDVCNLIARMFLHMYWRKQMYKVMIVEKTVIF